MYSNAFLKTTRDLKWIKKRKCTEKMLNWLKIYVFILCVVLRLLEGFCVSFFIQRTYKKWIDLIKATVLIKNAWKWKILKNLHKCRAIPWEANYLSSCKYKTCLCKQKNRRRKKQKYLQCPPSSLEIGVDCLKIEFKYKNLRVLIVKSIVNLYPYLSTICLG